MQVRDVKVALEAFQTLFPGPTSFQVLYSPPWHFREAQQQRVPYESDRGIYLYSQPITPDWRVPFDQNGSQVWYIGKSDAALAGRVWSHVGQIYEPGTYQRPSPLFKYHQWADLEAFPLPVRRGVADGDVVVYTVKVEPVGPPPGWPSVLEKYLLVCAYRADGKLPPLNVGM